MNLRALSLYPIRGTLLTTLLAALCVLGTSCSSEIIDSDSPPEKQYAEGERLLKKERFIEAVERFRILKSRFPYSKYAALATLRIGDSYYQEESYIEAASSYKIFRELYPKHEFAAYALRRIGDSFYEQMPSSIDRDLEPAHSGIKAYTQLLRDYPSSDYKGDAEKRVRELRGKLAEKEEYIGEFYFKRELYSSAAPRFAVLVDTYSDYGFNKDALYRLAFSYERMGEYTKATEALDRLDREFPDGKDDGNRKNLRRLISLATSERSE